MCHPQRNKYMCHEYGLITYLAASAISWSSAENEELLLKSSFGTQVLVVVCACMIRPPASTAVFKPGVK